MIKQDYFPTGIGDQLTWVENFRNKIAGYATELGLRPAVVTALLLDCDNVVFALSTYRSGVTSFSAAAFQAIDDAMQKATPATPIMWPSFTPPAAPTAVNNGALRRIFTLINDTIKKAPGYTNVIGADLRLIAPPKPAPSPTDSPSFTLRATGGNKLEVVWKKGVYNGVRLEFDLGEAGLRADVDLTPNYTLNWMPAPGTAARIKVRLRYIYKGEDFGNWSSWQEWTLTGD